MYIPVWRGYSWRSCPGYSTDAYAKQTISVALAGQAHTSSIFERRQDPPRGKVCRTPQRPAAWTQKDPEFSVWNLKNWIPCESHSLPSDHHSPPTSAFIIKTNFVLPSPDETELYPHSLSHVRTLRSSSIGGDVQRQSSNRITSKNKTVANPWGAKHDNVFCWFLYLFWGAANIMV